jgi:dihydroorotase
METTLIQKATILDVHSKYNGQVKDILIQGGIIKEIADTISDKGVEKIYKADDQFVSNGWIDMQANFCDPGFEHKEDLLSGLKAAANGGFTMVCPTPNTNPPISNKTQIEYLLNKSKSFNSPLPQILPIGTITQNREGKDIAEMYDMILAGAKGFSDSKKSMLDSGILYRALMYAKNINATLMLHCNDAHLSLGGLMHEGAVSTKMGVKGMPAIAEEIELQRNISLLAYADGSMHINTISTAGSVDLVRQAKLKGLKITCGVAIANLLYSDEQLSGFDSFYKVNPPFRSAEHIDALKAGLLDGTIDVIVSDHNPHDIESKDVEFDFADFGMSTIETFLPMILASKLDLSTAQLVEKLVTNPTKILGLNKSKILEGERSNLTVFNFDLEWNYSGLNKKSKAVNSVFVDKNLRGKAVIVV